METLLDNWEQTFYTFLPIFTRMTSFWAVIPVMRRGVPSYAKIGIIVFFSLVLLPVVPEMPAPDSLVVFAIQTVGEALIGLSLGFMVSLVFSSLYLAGQLIDVPIGFGLANIFDPQTGDNVPMIAQFQNTMTVLLFFILNGHHALLANFAQSFHVLPLGETEFSPHVWSTVLRAFSSLFVLSVRIALPIVAVIFVTDVVLGILTRAVPQMNVFVIGFPAKILVGLLIYTITFPIIVGLIARLVGPDGNLISYLQYMMWQFGDGA